MYYIIYVCVLRCVCLRVIGDVYLQCCPILPVLISSYYILSECCLTKFPYYIYTPFTRTTYSHLNPHPNSVPFTRTSRKSSLVMQAALFHATRVRDASAMVFAKLLQLLLLFLAASKKTTEDSS